MLRTTAPSISGERRIRSRISLRSVESRLISPARFTAMRMKSTSFSPANSPNPRFRDWLSPARPTTVEPANVTIGTPIQ